LKTTLYNHIELGTKDKPLIPNIIFKSLLTLLEYKKFEDCEYILKNYTLEKNQLLLYEQVNEIYNK